MRGPRVQIREMSHNRVVVKVISSDHGSSKNVQSDFYILINNYRKTNDFGSNTSIKTRPYIAFVNIDEQIIIDSDKGIRL